MNVEWALPIISYTCRMENLSIGTYAGKAKVVGTILGIGGAMLFTFYKGIQIHIWSTNVNLLNDHSHQNSHAQAPSSVHKDFGSLLLGSVVSLGSCTSYAIWLIIQVFFFLLFNVLHLLLQLFFFFALITLFLLFFILALHSFNSHNYCDHSLHLFV